MERFAATYNVLPDLFLQVMENGFATRRERLSILFTTAFQSITPNQELTAVPHISSMDSTLAPGINSALIQRPGDVVTTMRVPIEVRRIRFLMVPV